MNRLRLGAAVLVGAATLPPAAGAAPIQDLESHELSSDADDRDWSFERDYYRLGRDIRLAACRSARDARRQAWELRRDLQRAAREMREEMRAMRDQVRQAARQLRRELRESLRGDLRDRQRWDRRGRI